MEVRPFSGSQASARQSLTARRSRAVDRSRERHGWSIGVRVRPHLAPHGASLPVGRSVFESQAARKLAVIPLTIGIEKLRRFPNRSSASSSAAAQKLASSWCSTAAMPESPGRPSR